jgi:hypothetical protein
MKVGIVGLGKRVKNYYLPILKAIENTKVDLVWSRTEKTIKESVDHSKNIKATTNIEDFYKNNINLDLVVVCLPESVKYDYVTKILLHTDAIVTIETPVANNNFIKFCNENNFEKRIIAMEQWPFLFIERVKKEIIKKFIPDKQILFIENQWRYFDYHGISLMNDYFENRKTIKKIIANIVNFKSEPLIDGRVIFNDNTVLSHRFSYTCKKEYSKSIQNMKILFDNNSIIHCNINIKNSNNEFFNVVINEEKYKCFFEENDASFKMTNDKGDVVEEIIDENRKEYSSKIQNFDEHHSAMIHIFNSILKNEYLKTTNINNCFFDYCIVNNLKYVAYNDNMINIRG